MRAVVVVVVAAIAAAVACLKTVSYQCSSDSFCQHDGVQGTCESTSYCAFPDTGCTSGKRYGNAGPYANQCVGIEIDAPQGRYTIGGSASGLSGTGLMLRNNGTDTLSVPTNGPFTFGQLVMTGSGYNVIVVAAPTGQQCTVLNATGTVGSANVTNIQADCFTSGTDPGIACGGSNCSPVGTQKCCHDSSDALGMCAGAGSACGTGQISQPCDDIADCGGGAAICCAHIAPGGAAKTVSCVSGTSQCTPQGNETVEFLCDPAASAPCPGTMTCIANATFGWHYCQ